MKDDKEWQQARNRESSPHTYTVAAEALRRTTDHKTLPPVLLVK